MDKIKRFKKGFTLVELVVVIAVIAILAAVSVGAYFGVTNSANESKLRTEGKAVLDSVRIVALEGKGNYTYEIDGLYIKNSANPKQKFNFELNSLSGVNYIIEYSEPEQVKGPTLYLYSVEDVNNANNESLVYTNINYYSVDVAGKHAIIDILSGDITVGTNNIEISEDKNRPTVSDPTDDEDNNTEEPDVDIDLPIQGEDGNSLLTGNGIPESTLGKDGDSYINLDNWDFYVKNNGTWNLEGNIKGESGNNGESGAVGPQGPQGDKGDQGETGPQGPQGETGPQGPAGNDGHTPEITIGQNGNWFIDGEDTGVSSVGRGIERIEYKNGYYVLIENKYEDEAFDMKLMLKGLEYEGNIRDVYFKLNEQEIKQFKLQVSENINSGIVSFQFQFADM